MIIDFHSHILPGVDHGSDSIAVSRRQIILASRFGIDRIVATSHFYPHSRSATSFLERRERAFVDLKNAVGDTDVKLALGAEVLMCNSIENLPYISELCIQGTKTMLLELPFSDFQSSYCHSIYNLCSSGYTVVMAHAERYDKSWINEALEAGARLQLNAEAFSPFKIKRIVPWLESGDVVAIGSDIHGADASAYKAFLRANKKIYSIAPQIVSFSDNLWENIKKNS